MISTSREQNHQVPFITVLISIFHGLNGQTDLGFPRFTLLYWRINRNMLFLLLQGAQLRKHIDATLGSGNLREAVKLPPGEDLNEWLAVNSNYHSLSDALSKYYC